MTPQKSHNKATPSAADPLIRLLNLAHPYGLTLLLAGLSVLILGWQLHLHMNHQLQLNAQRYGQALANMTAEQAEPAMLSQDRVSLNALLADLTRNLDVAGATIHDVENRLLVQSGSLSSANPFNRLLQFSAPIVLQDSVAGVVTVSISAQTSLNNRYRLYGRMLISLALLLALVGLGAWYYRPGYRPPAKPVVETANPEKPAPRIKLTLDLLNLEQRHTELNGEAFTRLLARFETQLQGVIALYGGESLGLQNHQITLLFADDLDSEACFRAICSAELLHALSQGGELSLQLGARILPFEASADLKTQYSRQLKPGGVRATLISVTLLDETLADRCQFAARADQKSARVEQLLPPYRALLDNQLDQLRQLA